MNIDLLEMGREALWLAVLVSAPVVLVALVVGLLVGLFQAASQIQEFTLGFVPKILAVLVTIAMISPWMGHQLLRFTRSVLGAGL